MAEQFAVAFIHGAGSRRLTPQQRAERREAHRQPIFDGIAKIGLEDYQGEVAILEYVDPPSGRGIRKLRAHPAGEERHHRLPNKEIMCSCCGQRPFPARAAGTGFFARLRDLNIVHNGADAARNLSINPGGLHEVWEYLAMTNRREGVLASLANQLPAGPYVLWGHSLGSVIALELAAYLREGDEPEVLVTSGSPLDLRKVRQELLTGVQDWAANCREVPWVNVYDGYDIINPNKDGLRNTGYGPIVDVKVRNGENYHSGIKYLAHQAAWDQIYQLMQ